MDLNMAALEETGSRSALAGLLRSYVADLRAWAVGLAAGYGAAVAMLAGGIVALFAAAAVGITALFRLIERHYGTDIAFGAIGGGLLLLAIVLVLGGWAMLRRRVPSLPRPHRQAAVAKRMVTPAALSTFARLGKAQVERNPATQLYVGLAAAMLLYLAVGSRLSRKRRPRG